MLILNLARLWWNRRHGRWEEDRMQAGPVTAAVTREYRMRDPVGPPKQAEEGASSGTADVAFQEKTDSSETARAAVASVPAASVPELPSLESVRAQRVAARRVSDATLAAQRTASDGYAIRPFV